MRNITRFVSLVLTISVCFLYFGALMADDAVQAAPNHYKVVLENDKVRVLEFTGKKGDKIPMHTHPNYTTYYLSDGKGKFTKDGTTTEAELKKGETMWHEAETHSVEVLTDAHVLIVELK
jgi:quercetin dioxygenase-like cupin family protein